MKYLLNEVFIGTGSSSSNLYCDIIVKIKEKTDELVFLELIDYKIKHDISHQYVSFNTDITNLKFFIQQVISFYTIDQFDNLDKTELSMRNEKMDGFLNDENDK